MAYEIDCATMLELYRNSGSKNDNSSGFDVTLPNNHFKAPTHHLWIFIFSLEFEVENSIFFTSCRKTRAK